MSHASATHVTRSARITEAAPARPLLVVEHLDHSAGSTVLFTYCAQSAPAGTAQFTYCAQTAPTGAFGAQTAAPVAVEGDAVVGCWT